MTRGSTPPGIAEEDLGTATLFDRVLGALRTEALRARDLRDVPAFRFWNGLRETVEAMARDLAEDPRDAPEVRRYLLRCLAARRELPGPGLVRPRRPPD